MAKRELQEINAGSMADIAFLLLIFFLVTTTMDQDSGILRQLPPIVEQDPDPDKVFEKNVFEVLVNANDQLLVEGEYIQIDKLKDKTMLFLTNKGVFSDEPGLDDQTARIWVDVNAIKGEVARYTSMLDEDPEDNSAESNLKIWKAKLDAISFFGKYKELDKAAIISLKNDNGTSYDMYLQVQNELTSAYNELRDELTTRKFNKKYLELDKMSEKDRRIIKAVQQIYPQRISEAEPNQ